MISSRTWVPHLGLVRGGSYSRHPTSRRSQHDATRGPRCGLGLVLGLEGWVGNWMMRYEMPGLPRGRVSSWLRLFGFPLSFPLYMYARTPIVVFSLVFPFAGVSFCGSFCNMGSSRLWVCSEGDPGGLGLESPLPRASYLCFRLENLLLRASF